MIMVTKIQPAPAYRIVLPWEDGYREMTEPEARELFVQLRDAIFGKQNGPDELEGL